MCGIVAAAASSNIVNVLIEALKKLEYRGYDSAGIAYARWATHGAPWYLNFLKA
jgi:glucosamine--fructose-6-phosphate aminotransferase (isomerizing)